MAEEPDPLKFAGGGPGQLTLSELDEEVGGLHRTKPVPFSLEESGFSSVVVPMPVWFSSLLLWKRMTPVDSLSPNSVK